ncbi:MAG: UDP-2,3-diacylglucosamine diphosphatase LpxI [Gemmataceae bacterium]|nr:UDP-2,3-diacylglucosamine diphosphatase LpxI [Gemmataceae bacterium]
MSRTVGLIAGWGRFPVLFAEKARRMGHRVCCVGLKGLASDELPGACDEYHSVGIAKWGRIVRTLRRSGVRDIVMAGKIHKTELLRPGRIWDLVPDFGALKFWYGARRRDNRDDSLLLGVISEIERRGFHCASALDFCPELLVQKGVITRRSPSAGEMTDVKFGWELAKEMGRLDVGQSVAVRDRAVLAVEAIEGTDSAIRRAGELARGGAFVVVKVAKPQQDMRFDVPTVGTSTVETMHKAGGRVLAVEAGQTIIIDEAETVALADRFGISIVAL